MGIGSSQLSDTYENPLSAAQRKKIVMKALSAHRIKARLILIPDFKDDSDWSGYLMKRVKGLDVIFSRNPWVIKVMTTEGVKVFKPSWERRSRLSGRLIRERIRNGREYAERLPVSIPVSALKRIRTTASRRKSP